MSGAMRSCASHSGATDMSSTCGRTAPFAQIWQEMNCIHPHADKTCLAFALSLPSVMPVHLWIYASGLHLLTLSACCCQQAMAEGARNKILVNFLVQVCLEWQVQ